MEWQFYREILRRVSGSAAYIDLETPPLKAGEYLEVSHISVEDQTTAYTNLRIGIKSVGEFIPVEEEKVPAAGEVYWSKNPMVFYEHERVCCRLTGCTSGDVLQAVIMGKLYFGSS